MPVILIRKAIPSDNPLIQAAEKLEGRIQRAFIDAVNAVKDSVTLDDIAAAIAAGDSGRVYDLLDIDNAFAGALQGSGLASGVKSVREALQDTFAAGAKAALQTLPTSMQVQTSFNLFNPETVKFLDSYSMDLIKEISVETREAIQSVVTRAFQEGGSPAQQAREIRDSIGLTARQEAAVENYRNALESGGAADLKAALSRSLRDGRYDSTLLRSIQNSKALDQAKIDQMVARYQERFVAYRAKTIARTESLRASNRGQGALWRQAVDQGYLSSGVKRVWVVSGDDRTCPQCLDLEDEERGLDEEFEPGVMEPPLHPSCRCSLALVKGTMAA